MDKVLVLDFGGQYDQLIARHVREMSVYAEIRTYNKISPEQIIEEGYKAVILTGGPNSVYLDESPHYDRKLIEIGIPVLGICYGAAFIKNTYVGRTFIKPGQADRSDSVNIKLNIHKELIKNKRIKKQISICSDIDRRFVI